MSTAIKQLDNDVIKGLRTGVTAPSFVQIVEELIVNAIDAGATHVDVSVNFDQYQVVVSDNGHGICTQNLPLIGKRYCTSKCRNMSNLDKDVSTYGFRGEALASLRDVGDLSVVTRCSHCGPEAVTYCKEMYQQSAEQTCAASVRRSTHGTTVSVRNIFQRLPVRRKSLVPRLEMDAILWRIKRIALINPETSFRFTNATIGACMLKTQRAQSVAAIYGQLFGKDKASHLFPIESTVSAIPCRYSVNGYIGLKGHHSGNLQFVYVNGRFVSKSPINKLMSRLLSQHVFDRISSDESSRDRIGRRPQQYGVYCLNVSCAPQEYDICFEPGKTIIEFREWTSLLKILEGTVRKFIENRYVRAEELSSDQLQLLSTSAAHPQAPEHDMQKHPRAADVSDCCMDITSDTTDSNSVCKTGAKFTSSANLNANSFQYTAPRRGVVQSKLISSAAKSQSLLRAKIHSSSIRYKSTGRTSRVKPPVEPVRSRQQKSSHFEDCDVFFARKKGFGSRSLFESQNVLVPSKGSAHETIVSTVTETMDKNPGDLSVLKSDLSDKWISFMSSDTSDIPMPPRTCYLNRNSSALQPTSFTKEVFAQLDVIAQCDKKFIVCLLPDDTALVSGQRPRSRLIFVDQHAAHERVLLEQFRSECFATESGSTCASSIRIRLVHSPAPLRIPVSQEDAHLLLQYRSCMERWGIQYRLVSTGNNSTLSIGDTMNIISIPEVMAGFNSETIQDYVKEQLLLLRDTAGGGTAVLPRMVMDLLKSRACTSAIKFGDYLDLTQCKSLIARLSKCDLPFQCAHGRPSLLPIVTFSRSTTSSLE
eukprot:m.321980 g.321980  ORF g.321980 m.321980 type:complete len:817 (-) comp20342_c0_seq1:457-2907(-)